jgi:hypothetical protein
MELMSIIIDVDPFSFEEAIDQEVWEDVGFHGRVLHLYYDELFLVHSVKTRGEVSCKFHMAL